MLLKKPNDGPDETHVYLAQSLATGILHWQELAHLDFQDLTELARKQPLPLEESELW